MTPATVTSTVRVGAYALEVGADSGSFAQFESEREEVNAQTLGAALTEEQEEPTFVAAVEELNESASAVTNKIERAHGLFRAAAEGRLLDRDVLMGEIDELLGLSERLDRSKRFEEQLRLARALHGLLAVTFRWLDLIRSLRRALQSAKEARDRAGEAWALHELGSLYLCAGDAKTAARSFREAFRIQEQLGGGGWCATRHNLDCARRDLAAPSAGSLTDPRRPRGRLARLLTIRGAKGIVVFLLLVLLVATGGTAAGIAVTRHGAPLQPALDRETLTFGASLVGETSPPKTLVLRAGSEAIVFSRVTVGRDDEFLVDDRCPTRLAARAACAIELRFRPSAPGLRTSWLSVKLGKAGIVSAELVGTAREAVDAAFSPSSLEFGEVELGAASESKTLTLTAGSKKLTILGIATATDEFRVSSN
jgi:hypothetical protein